MFRFDLTRFADRAEAGRLLAERVKALGLHDPVVYALRAAACRLPPRWRPRWVRRWISCSSARSVRRASPSWRSAPSSTATRRRSC